MDWLGPVVGLLLLGILFTPIERKWPLIKRRFFRPLWFTDALHVVLTGALANLAAILGIVAAWLLVGWWAPSTLQTVVQGQPMALQLAEVVVLGNIIGYWAHRWSHEVPMLWRFHKVHHSSKELDWLAAARRHPLEETWNALVFAVPLIFLGFQVTQVAAVQIAQVLWAIFIHANVSIRFPVLRQVVATPEFHHWHHSADPRRYNTNYSIFPWLDRMFGTYYQPGKRTLEFGVPGYAPGGYVRQMLEPFRRKRIEYGPFPASTGA